MRQFFNGRGEIFTVASVIGASVDVVWFVYRSTETWNYLDISFLHPYVLYICVAASLLPTLLLYLLFFGINRVLINVFAKDEFRARQMEIIAQLIRGHAFGLDVEKRERDLLDELAWARLKDFWRDR
jgi:hypothetical protein